MANCPTVSILAQSKKLALRRKVWFRVLNRVERGVIDLTLKCVDTIRSGRLAKVVTAILVKLESASESTVDVLVRTLGLPLAQKISRIAVCWGNFSALAWAGDPAFAKFLVVNFGKI